MKALILNVLLVFLSTQLIAMEEKSGDHAGRRVADQRYGFEFSHLGSFENAIHQYLKERPQEKKRVIEFGAGYGRLALGVVKQVKNVEYIATDITESQVDDLKNAAKNRLDLAEGSSMSAEVCDCTENAQFDDASFDAVIIANVVHFLHPSQVLRVFDNAQRLLKPNGRLFIMTESTNLVSQEMLMRLHDITSTLRTKRLPRHEFEALAQQKFEIMCALYNPSSFCEMARIYRHNKMPFPGLLVQNNLEGIYSEGKNASRPHNVMNSPFLLLLEERELSDLGVAFGFVTLSAQQYYIFKDAQIQEAEQGAYVGIVLEKRGAVKSEDIVRLKGEAATADSARAKFHEAHKVKYFSELPFLAVEVNKNYCSTCFKQASLTCQRCRSVYYCDSVCQRAHWPTHKPTCNK